jgi:hypothetical protein
VSKKSASEAMAEVAKQFLEHMPLSRLVRMMVWEGRETDESDKKWVLDEFKIPEDVRSSCDLYRAVIDVVTARLLKAPRYDASALIVDFLMIAMLAIDNCRVYDHTLRKTCHSAAVLVNISDILTDDQRVQLRDRLYCDLRRTLSDEFNEFDPYVGWLLPVLGARHPSLEVDVDDAVLKLVQYSLKSTEFDVVLPILQQLPMIRKVMSENTRVVVSYEISQCMPWKAEAIRQSSANEHCSDSIGEYHMEMFKDAAFKALFALRKSSLTWVRIVFRVRVIGRLSLMMRESAARVYAPGGAGARGCIDELGRLAKRQRTPPEA